VFCTRTDAPIIEMSDLKDQNGAGGGEAREIARMLEAMQAQFVQMASAVVSRIDTRASRLDDLERHIARLDDQASGLKNSRQQPAGSVVNQTGFVRSVNNTLDLTRRLRDGNGLSSTAIPTDTHCLLLCENDLLDLSALPLLPQLESFDARANKLSDNLNFLLSLSALRSLFLDENNIVTLPDNLRLPNLVEMSMSFNKLSHIADATLASMPLLQILWLESNALQTLNVTRNTALTSISLTRNQLTSVVGVNNLSKLVYIQLDRSLLPTTMRCTPQITPRFARSVVALASSNNNGSLVKQ